MSDEFIEVEVDEDEVMRGLDYQEAFAKRWMVDFLEDLASRGKTLLEGYAPQGDTRYTKDHIDSSNVMVGLGGYQVIVGIKAGTSYHPVYANSGTGLYGRYNDFVQSPTGKLMYFYASRLGHVISMYLVEGQKPQHFLYDTWRDLAIYAETHMLTKPFI